MVHPGGSVELRFLGSYWVVVSPGADVEVCGHTWCVVQVRGEAAKPKSELGSYTVLKAYSVLDM